MSDYFSVFGLPRRLQLDQEELRQRFYALSRQHHPDFHQLAGERERAEALASSALTNRAYRALRDPVGRGEYLVALEDGRDGKEGAGGKPKPPRHLLEGMLGTQEALEEAKSSGLDNAARDRLRGERDRLAARRAQTEAEIVSRSAEWDAAVDQGVDRAPILAWFREALAARSYLGTVIDDLSQALGEGQQEHGANRRH